MTDQIITCANCGEAIELTEALTEQINKELRVKIEKDFSLKLKAELKAAEEKARKTAGEELRVELDDLREQLSEKSDKVEELQKQEIDLRKEKRALEAAKKEFELEMQRTIDEQRETLSEEISKDLEEKHRFKDLEKDKKLTDLMRQLDEARRRAEQGSQQTQGEVVELEIEEQLKLKFPIDRIEPVGKGVRGADILQTVKNDKLTECGSIIWEFKRTKNWSNDWVAKLKDDQREAKADIAVIATEALPAGIENFGELDGVWIASYPFLIELASAFRSSLITIAASKTAEVGKHHKMELLYEYLHGPEFRQRIQAMVEAFGSMKGQIEKEKAAMNRIWSKREKEIDRYVRAVSGMYGDMEGIVGLTLPAINQLQLTGGDDDEDD